MATIKDLKKMCEMHGKICGGCPFFEWCGLLPIDWKDGLDEDVDKWLAVHPEVIRKVNVGAKYRHFKGGVYTVLGVAHHSETGEELVIYQRDNDGSENAGKICARPVGMFLSSVDKVKCPDVEQKFRFEELPAELAKAPVVDAQPVVHSRREISSDGYYPYCKNCNAKPESGKMTKYCAECGARMDGEKHE